ncbi:DEAD/DEAH box helicase [Aquimarina agarivorans]|uniref:DEAD/DEAH box helicase n=1 Tax=Aquimarina agarivorans TaxID=980584 RepID=UPI000248EB1E|nr:DEAD/DEAH box helicase [Aquimarina agarivorans]
MKFTNLNLNTPLTNALNDLGFETATPIQAQSYPVIMSGKDVIGIAQTGTGKTLAYLLPILRVLPYSKQLNPRVLILVPTRELVVQVVGELEKLSTYINNRILGIYGGTNINTQKKAVAQGADIIVATPGRLYDLALARAIALKSIQKLVIDEVDVMLDLGFKFQIENIIELLPRQRQGILFSATMTDKVTKIIKDSFINPTTISVAVSGTPLHNITQTRYTVPNFYTKLNLLARLLDDYETFHKTIIFAHNKRMADRIYDFLETTFTGESCVIHSNKTQNYRLRSIRQFEEGDNRILIATDVMARGIDIDSVSQVISLDTPDYPENYIHRIGRTGRAEKKGSAILMTTPKEMDYLENIENLMKIKIDELPFPDNVEISTELTPEERPKVVEIDTTKRRKNQEPEARGAAFHEKSEKNSKTNQGGSYRREIAKKYKKPKTKGDKNYNRRNKRK